MLGTRNSGFWSAHYSKGVLQQTCYPFLIYIYILYHWHRWIPLNDSSTDSIIVVIKFQQFFKTKLCSKFFKGRVAAWHCSIFLLLSHSGSEVSFNVAKSRKGSFCCGCCNRYCIVKYKRTSLSTSENISLAMGTSRNMSKIVRIAHVQEV